MLGSSCVNQRGSFRLRSTGRISQRIGSVFGRRQIRCSAPVRKSIRNGCSDVEFRTRSLASGKNATTIASRLIKNLIIAVFRKSIHTAYVSKSTGEAILLANSS